MWTDGYVSDITYTSGFYRELSPYVLSAACLSVGALPPPPRQYLELACGQGFGTALLAAANPGLAVTGLDFNPAQIAHARQLAAEAQLDQVQFVEASFQQAVVEPSCLAGPYDIIALHGIYSWVSQANRAAIVQVLDRCLAPGGLAYVSYNAMPGWAAMAPVQRLLRSMADSRQGRSDQRVSEALAFLEDLREAGSGFHRANPSVGDRQARLVTQNRVYLAHEYLNGHWHPLYHAEVAEEVQAAKLHFVASATLFETIPDVAIPPAMRPFIERAPTPVLAETLRDYAINQQFRRDIFARGVVTPGAVAVARARRLLTQHLVMPAPEDPVVLKTPLGDATAKAEIYRPLLDHLTRHGGASVATALADPALAPLGEAALQQALLMLAGAGIVQPGLPMDQAPDCTAARRFNRVVANRVMEGAEYSFLAAPRIGSGVAAGFLDMATVAALGQGITPSVPALCAALWRLLQDSGRRLMRDGAAVTTEDETIAMIRPDIEVFVTKRLPIWQHLGVV